MTSLRLLLLAAIAVSWADSGPVSVEGESGELLTKSEVAAPDRIELNSHIHTRSANGPDDPFVFPDELPEPPKKVQDKIKEEPTCPDGKEFCENTDGYPEDYISNVLTNKISEYSGMFGVGGNTDQEHTIGHKVDPSAEKPLCPSREEEIEIRAAKNIYNEWRYVVNQGNYTQRVRMEVCMPTKPGTYCNRINLGFRTECKQKYVYHKLIALNRNRDVGPDVFRIPSCCACVLKTDKQNVLLRVADSHPTTPANKTNK